MSIISAQSLHDAKDDIIREIICYMKYGTTCNEEGGDPETEFDAGYDQTDVDRCEAILDDFISAIQDHRQANSDVLLADVKTTVQALNRLNDECNCSILETDQRESICKLIANGLRFAGMEPSGDVTEPWREW